MTLHPEVLTDRQVHVLDAIASVAEAAGFYLGGGTAVALRCGHRRSEDFVWVAADVRRPEVRGWPTSMTRNSNLPEMLAGITWADVRDGITDALRAVVR